MQETAIHESAMFRKNQRHLQRALLSDLDHLTAKQRKRLDESWAGVFRREVFARLDEAPFAVLYSDEASRPNIPVNVLVGLETLKAGNNWSDEEMHDAFSFDLQVRYALGYENLGDGEFDLRTVYNFRHRLSAHMQATGQNLMDQAFVQVSDAQLEAFQLATQQLRMDTTQIASNIREASRLQLLVEVLQRVHRMLDPLDQARYADACAPYLKGHAGQYVYHLKGEETAPHVQRIGELMQQLVNELATTYAAEPIYQVLQRVFQEHFQGSAETVQTRPGTELSADSLRSLDDVEATYRKKGNRSYQGYVTNVTETCDPANPFQLIVQVQTAPNVTEDAALLVEALPGLKARTGVKTLYNDAGFCSATADRVLQEQHVVQVPTNLRGKAPNPARLGLADFSLECRAEGLPERVKCPQGQSVVLTAGRKPQRYRAQFAAESCQTCPLARRCPTRVSQRDASRSLTFSQTQAAVAQRRQRCVAYHQAGHNLRAAVEATVGALKRPFSDDQVPVRGCFRVGVMMIGSALMVNVRRIQRYWAEKTRPPQPPAAPPSAESLPSDASNSFLTSLWNRMRSRLVSMSACPVAFQFSC
jgi:hypothetical protein